MDDRVPVWRGAVRWWSWSQACRCVGWVNWYGVGNWAWDKWEWSSCLQVGKGVGWE